MGFVNHGQLSNPIYSVLDKLFYVSNKQIFHFEVVGDGCMCSVWLRRTFNKKHQGENMLCSLCSRFSAMVKSISCNNKDSLIVYWVGFI